MYKYIAKLDDSAYENFAKSVSVAKVITSIGIEKFPLKGDYIILCKDAKGVFILPAFSSTEVPHNRCLSEEVKKKVENGKLEIGCIYKLHVKCRFITSPDKHYKRCENRCPEILIKYPICRVGKPAEDCWENFSPRFGDWDYNNPECACWDFSEKDKLNIDNIKTSDKVSITELIQL